MAIKQNHNRSVLDDYAQAFGDSPPPRLQHPPHIRDDRSSDGWRESSVHGAPAGPQPGDVFKVYAKSIDGQNDDREMAKIEAALYETDPVQGENQS